MRLGICARWRLQENDVQGLGSQQGDCLGVLRRLGEYELGVRMPQ
jgi:hypothetical protein